MRLKNLEQIPKIFKRENKFARKNSAPLKVVLQGLQRDAELQNRYRKARGLND